MHTNSTNMEGSESALPSESTHLNSDALRLSSTNVNSGSLAQLALDHFIAVGTEAALGSVVDKNDIKSTLSPFQTLPSYKTQYPQVVVDALCELYTEYNKAFAKLVELNREWDSDYQHCFSPEGMPLNYFVQVDMVGLPEGFLQAAKTMNKEDVRETLRGRIFEFENSLACYQLLERIFERDTNGPTFFKHGFRESLDQLRALHSKPVALLAVTEQKYEAMRASEFGKRGTEPLTDAEVKQLSGFDAFFGPNEFKQYLAQNQGRCDYLLYVRSSDPVEKLKKPDTVVNNPLIADPETRRIIKANTVTFNIDAPGMAPENRINDTKEYLQTMRMGFVVKAETDLYSPAFIAHLTTHKPNHEFNGAVRFSDEFRAYLSAQGLEPEAIEKGEVMLRAKPLKGTYGCYGHVRGTVNDKDFRWELRTNIKRRGDYVVQPELDSARVLNQSDGQMYSYIDRNFLSFTAGGPKFIGGFRSLMLSQSNEAKNGRVHGSAVTVWAEITPELDER